jgi:hypothetical protein
LPFVGAERTFDAAELAVHVAYLDIPQRSFSPISSGVEHFWTLASTLGHRFEVPERADDFVPLIRRADAIILPSGMHLRTRDVFEALHARVMSGARMLVCGGERDAEQLNALLAHYQMFLVDVRIRSNGLEPHILRIQRGPDTFRDERIFRGVDEVVLLEPNAIWCRGQSRALLVPDRDVLAYGEANIEQSRIQPRELPCMGLWEGPGRAAVLLTAGSLLLDPFSGPGGVPFPGIAANRTLVTNMLTFISEPAARTSAREAAP